MAAALSDEASRVTLEAWLVTDVGVVRDHNEDSAFMEPAKGFFIVADGMGGHAAGEVASAMAVETVRKTLEGARTEIEAFKKAPSDAGRRGIVQLLQNAVLGAHQAVYQRGQAEPDKAGMGTTLDVVLVAGPEAFVAHVGDSRTYLIRDGKPSQITTDHTVAEVLVIEGKLTIEEAQVSPLRTILVNAIGVSADVGVEMAHVTLKRNDRLLLCSDGMHDYFPAEDEIAQRLSAEKPGEALAEMVELAKTRGGHDNITGVVCQVIEINEAIPGMMEGESTQPVELPHNPFASDEPTETAIIGTSPPGVPPRMIASVSPQTMRQTQPMRAVSDDSPLGRADTIPPEGKDGKRADAKAKSDAPSKPADAEEIDVEGKTEPARSSEPASDKADDVKPDDAKPDDAKPDDAKPDDDKAATEKPAGDAKADAGTTEDKS